MTWPAEASTAPGARRRVPARVALMVLLVAALVAALALLVVDQRRLRVEVTAVQECQERAEQAAVLADRRLDRTATYLSPARVPDSSLAARLLSRAALVAREPLDEADRACSEVQVRRWHPTTASRRDNVLAYLAARLGSLEDVAADGTRYYGGQADPELRRLRSRAFADPP